MKDNEISDKDIETATSYVKPFVQFLLEKQEHIIDYPKDEKGRLISQVPQCIIYLESESDVISDLPSVLKCL